MQWLSFMTAITVLLLINGPKSGGYADDVVEARWQFTDNFLRSHVPVS